MIDLCLLAALGLPDFSTSDDRGDDQDDNAMRDIIIDEVVEGNAVPAIHDLVAIAADSKIIIEDMFAHKATGESIQDAVAKLENDPIIFEDVLDGYFEDKGEDFAGVLDKSEIIVVELLDGKSSSDDIIIEEVIMNKTSTSGSDDDCCDYYVPFEEAFEAVEVGFSELAESNADYVIIEEIAIGKSAVDPIIIEDYVNIKAAPDIVITDIQTMHTAAMDMNKGDLINKVAESAGLRGTGDIVIEDIIMGKSAFDPIIIEDMVMGKMDYDAIDGAPEEKVATNYDGIDGAPGEDASEIIIVDIQSMRAEAAEMNKGDLINKVQEGAGRFIGIEDMDNNREIIIEDYVGSKMTSPIIEEILLSNAAALEMNKGDLINKVQEGAGLKAISNDFIVIEDALEV